MKGGTLIGMLLVAIQFGCKREEIVIDELKTNPFDTDYAGPALFTKVDERTVPYVINGIAHQRLELDVRVNTEPLNGNTGYGVSYRAIGVSSSVTVPATDLADGRFTMEILDVIAGTAYCAEVRITNGGGAGGGNTLCGMAQ